MASSDRLWRERGLHSAVLAGDEQAWRAWYDESYAPLDAYVLWRCAGLRDLADEIVQETWLTAVRRIKAFDPAQAAFLTWLRGIAANLVRNHWRRKRQPLAASHPPADDTGRREQSERISQVLARLPERYEAVLREKYLEQQTVDDIARKWNETPKAIESLLSRARQAFRDAFGIHTAEENAVREV